LSGSSPVRLVAHQLQPPKVIIRIVDLFEVILPVGDPAEEPEPTPRRALPDLVHGSEPK